ncbi:MAG: hypothetical protein BHW64_02615 [Candidatus Melainabacteria bacterium LEY3_CP_29_8]|nr:MAG: hypothetical protein BHW64_02615 [Candidatus Melainabacteria bacterium LEY3_CP_29_8]
MPQKLVACEKIHLLIAETINHSADKRKLSNIISSIKFRISHKDTLSNFVKVLNESKKSIEQAIYETCDSLFDVQIYKTNIMSVRNKFHITKDKRKEIISYCIDNNNNKQGKKNLKNISENINKALNINVSYKTIADIIYSVYNIPLFYNRFLMETCEPKTLENFQKFIIQTNTRNNFRATYRNIDILEYTIDKLNKKFYNNYMKFEEEKEGENIFQYLL